MIPEDKFRFQVLAALRSCKDDVLLNATTAAKKGIEKEVDFDRRRVLVQDMSREGWIRLSRRGGVWRAAITDDGRKAYKAMERIFPSATVVELRSVR